MASAKQAALDGWVNANYFYYTIDNWQPLNEGKPPSNGLIRWHASVTCITIRQNALQFFAKCKDLRPVACISPLHTVVTNLSPSNPKTSSLLKIWLVYRVMTIGGLFGTIEFKCFKVCYSYVRLSGP